MKNSTADTLSFTSLNLAPVILQAVTKKGYTLPSPVQAQAIPPIMAGRDVLAAAQTGTGKTAGFTLPLLNHLSKGEKARHGQVRALVLTPTRELAAQVHQNVKEYSHGLNLNSHVVFGGVNIKPQLHKLKKGTDILIATPGRLLDLYKQNALHFKKLDVLILDEADRMLDMGFIPAIKEIISLLPAQRQNLLFSATLSPEIRSLAGNFVTDPVEITVTPEQITVDAIEQVVYPVDKSQKSKLLIKLIDEGSWLQALVFTRTKHGANKLARVLGKQKINSDAIHGNKSQAARTKALSEFKKGNTQILVATDIAARGLDISQLPQVVNYDMPTVAEDYVHRIGRTGRAGATGHAVSLVSQDEAGMLGEIEKLTRQKISQVVIEGFEPAEELLVPEAPRKHTRQRKRNPNKKTRRKAGQGSSELSRSESEVQHPRRRRWAAKKKTSDRSESASANNPAGSSEQPSRSKKKYGRSKASKNANSGGAQQDTSKSTNSARSKRRKLKRLARAF